MRKSAVALCLWGAALSALPVHAQETPTPPASADAFVQMLEELRNDPVARAAAKETVSRRLEELRKTASQAQPALDEAKTALESSAAEAETLRGRIDELSRQLESARADLERLDQGFKEAQQRMEAMRQQQAEAATPLLVYERSLELLNALEEPSETPAPAAEAPAAPAAASDAVAKAAHDVLAANCFECHGPEKQKSSLRLDSRDAVLKGGTQGPAVVPGDPEQSLLLKVVRHEGDVHMPPKGKLDQPSIDALTEWVKQGAPWPGGAPAPPPEAAASPPAAPSPPTPATGAADRIHFSRDIRPVLSNNCFACHGPDDHARKAGLRLDEEAGAAKALAPGNPAQSEVLRRVTTDDPEDHMPPASTGKTLKPEEIERLRRWIEQGAKYEPHWAFVKPERPAKPAVADTAWARNDIDRFVLARLEQEGLKPSPEADKTTLLRRVTFDLTGLPPTPAEVDAFLADTGPDAYEKAVDRLLASPRYGEHMARYWLDLSRYADTNGYHIDNERYMWRWRDWVIDAFNRNMPFDRFTVEQLAGDLLPDATTDQRLATGFNRNHMITFEGGIIPEEYRVQYVVDRVNTTGTVWMGLTVSCAQCHDHKFDPITQREYFQLYGFYNSVDEQGSDGNKGNANPLMKAPTPEQATKLAELDGKVAQLREAMHRPDPQLDAEQAAWETEQRDKLRDHWTPVGLSETVSTGGATFEKLDDGSYRVAGTNADKDTYELAAVVDKGGITAVRLEALADPSLPQGGTGRADNGNFVLTEFEIEYAPADNAEQAQKVAFAGANADFSQDTFDVGQAVDGKPETGWAVGGYERRENRSAVFVPEKPFGFEAGTHLRIRLKHESASVRHNIGRFRLSVTSDPSMVPADAGPWYISGPFRADDGDKAYETAFEPEQQPVDVEAAYDDGRLKWVAMPEFADGQEHALKGDVVATYLYRTITTAAARPVTLSLGSNDSVKLWLNDELVHANPAKRPLKADEDKVEVELQAGENRLLMKVVNHGAAHAFFFRRAFERYGEIPVAVEAALAADGARTEAQAAALREFYRQDHWPEWKTLAGDLKTAQRERDAFDAQVPTAMVMADLPTPRETFILDRGAYDKPTEKVEPGTPAVLPPLPEDAPKSRLGLAKWLVDPANPLTARVAVNRYWAHYFGTGIVKTVQDFGVQGEWPSHPELLDWLATEFVRNGWDVKALQRLIVTSAAYRQSSRVTPELLERDPENRLLARGPRHRLDAEAIRDNALALSGLLVEKVGGPSVKPYQPAGLWEEVSFGDKNFTAQSFEQDHGEALYRRSMYSFWKRTAPPPTMVLFDAPNRELCTARRARTNTPLQALALLNDPQYVEAARALAQRTLKECAGTPEERIAWLFRVATSRAPGEAEAQALRKLYDAQLEEYRKDTEAATQLLAIGESPRDESLDPAELAAWTTVASTVLNMDETVTKG